MAKKQIKVIQYGIGPIGQKITHYLVERDAIRIVGAIDIDPEKEGKDLGELCVLGERLGVPVVVDSRRVLSNTEADIVVLTTTSSVERIEKSVIEILETGKNIVSTCEELTFPWQTWPEVARRIDKAAKDNNVSVLSTGVNPGFLMDCLPVVLTGVCRKVESIKVERIQDATFRRVPFKQKIGAGLTPEEFDKKVKEKTLQHVGLTESMHMIAAAVGWSLDKTEDIISPIMADRDMTTEGLSVKKGQAAGVCQMGRGYRNGEEVITLEFKAAIGQPDRHDRVYIKGEPVIDSTIKDGVNGDIATCAIVVNAIPVVIAAQPGLRSMIDIRPVAWY